MYTRLSKAEVIEILDRPIKEKYGVDGVYKRMSRNIGFLIAKELDPNQFESLWQETLVDRTGIPMSLIVASIENGFLSQSYGGMLANKQEFEK